MNAAEAIVWLTGIITALTALLVAVTFLFIQLKRVAEESKVIWSFLVRRGRIEATRGVSPAIGPNGTIDRTVRNLFASLIPEIQQYHLQEGFRLQDEQLALEIERRWGKRVIAEVCTPLGWHQGECLIVAVKLARETMKAGTPPGP